MDTSDHLLDRSDRWLEEDCHLPNLAVSTRARFARNLAGFPFVPHARKDVHGAVDKFVREAFERSETLRTWERLTLATLKPEQRTYLRESRLISKEMERPNEFLVVYVSPDATASILVNEEDHLRIQVLRPGLDLAGTIARLEEVDRAVGDVLGYAWSERYGYLTACPSNVGTGFRASVMLHLPGLTLLKDVESSLQGIAHLGLTVRGFDGENSEYLGDFYQVSNEVTLGRTVAQITELLAGVLKRVMDREEEARLELFRHHAAATDDSIWRSYGLLSHAVRMDSAEAMRLLSRLRLGIDRGYFRDFDHRHLNRLVLEIQPGHLERRLARDGKASNRDELRALYLREQISRMASRN